MATWWVRPAAQADAAALSELAERTFRDAFGALNRPEDMDLHCSRSFGPAIQAGEIADPAMHNLVVECEGALIAYAQLSRHGHRPRCVEVSPAVELRRIYVDRRWHGSGLARELMDRAFDVARVQGARALWLGVWERNPRAIRFHRNCGFAQVGDHVFLLGTDPQRDLVMVRDLGDAGNGAR